MAHPALLKCLYHLHARPTSLAVSDAGAAQLGLAVGDICDCYYEEDGRYYPARVDWMGQDRARVTYLGYEEVREKQCCVTA